MNQHKQPVKIDSALSDLCRKVSDSPESAAKLYQLHAAWIEHLNSQKQYSQADEYQRDEITAMKAILVEKRRFVPRVVRAGTNILAIGLPVAIAEMVKTLWK